MDQQSDRLSEIKILGHIYETSVIDPKHNFAGADL